MSRFFVTVLVAPLCLASLLVPEAARGEWTSQVIDSAARFQSTTPQAVALDSAGLPHVAYAGEALYHAWFDGSAWRREVVDTESALGAAIAIGADGRIHIAYRTFFERSTEESWPLQEIRCASGGPGDWTIATVDTPTFIGTTPTPHYDPEYGVPTIAIDGSGTLHLAYLSAFQPLSPYSSTRVPWRLTHAVRGESGWEVEYLAEHSHAHRSSTPNQRAVIAARGSSIVIVLYIEELLSGDPVQQPLYLFSTTGGAWTQEVVDPDVRENRGNSYGYPSIALDAAGKAHLAYGGIPREVRYATNASGSWERAIVDGTSDFGTGGITTSIAVEDAGTVHVAYSHVLGCGSLGVRHAVGTPGAWARETIAQTSFPDPVCERWLEIKWPARDTYYNPVAPVSLALAPDAVHVAFMDKDLRATNDSLSYAVNRGDGWSVTELDREGSFGEDSIIAVDAQGSVHVAYNVSGDGFRGPDEGLKYATNATGQWRTEFVGKGLHGGAIGPRDLGMALGPRGRVHIVHSDQTDVEWVPEQPYVKRILPKIRHYRRSATGWRSRLLFLPKGNSTLDLAADAAGRLHLSLASGPVYDGSTMTSPARLLYARRRGGIWRSRVMATMERGAENSLVVDPGGAAHLFFATIRETRKDLLSELTNAGRGWAAHRLARHDANLMYLDAARDADGVLHVVYDWEEKEWPLYDTLRYGNNRGGSWSFESIDGDAGRARIAIDSNGAAHLVYHRGWNVGGGVTYATNAGGTWTFRDLGHDLNEPDIAIDALDQVHISAHDPWLQDLVYIANLREVLGSLAPAAAPASDGHAGADDQAAELVNRGSREVRILSVSLETGGEGAPRLGTVPELPRAR